MIIDVSAVEELVLNPSAMPPGLETWRFYRLEYLHPEKIWAVCERVIYVPPRFDIEKLENLFEEAQA
jgi:hypothetical protein